MMDVNLLSILKILSEFGVLGLVIFLWWSDNKRVWAVISQHKMEIAAILERYNQDMIEQREMYRANASLCRDFASVASDLREIVTLNIQKMTQVDDAVRGNQFCPVMRIRKEKSIKLVPGQEGG
jgi:hypothetical protein